MKDDRLRMASKMIKEGKIKNLLDLIKVVPPTVVGKAAKINIVRFNGKLENVTKFTVEEVCRVGDVLTIDYLQMSEILFNEMKLSKKRNPLEELKKINHREKDLLTQKAHELVNSGLTKSEISDKLGITRATLNQYLSNDNEAVADRHK